LGTAEDEVAGKAPGFGIEVLMQVFSALGQEVSFETFPTKRAWMMVVRGERDGVLGTRRTGGDERFCSFPKEPLIEDKWVLFVRTSDIGKLKFSTFDDLIGHAVAIHEPMPAVLTQPTPTLELSKFLTEHHNLVVTDGSEVGLRMLAAGRVDYALTSLTYGKSEIAKLGLSGAIEPLTSRSLGEESVYVCFTKAHVSLASVDAFSHALARFKQTDAFQAIYRKYFP
jgi:polar amino acid transport system substrate-binding protein